MIDSIFRSRVLASVITPVRTSLLLDRMFFTNARVFLAKDGKSCPGPVFLKVQSSLTFCCCHH